MKNVLELLTEKGILKPGDASLVEKQAQGDVVALEDALNSLGITSEQILTTQSEFYNLPYRLVGTNPLSHEALAHISEESARHYRIVPLAIEDGALAVGVIDPDNIEALDALQFIATRTGMPYKLYLISEKDFARVIDEYKNLTGEVGEAVAEFEQVDIDVDSAVVSKKEEKIDETIKPDAPVTKIVSTIIRYAVEGKASDVHIEPTHEKTKVRFRQDGILHTSLELPSKVHPAVVARIKILSQMRLDEKRKPQDGRFSATLEDKRKIDFRVSTFPTQFGEKVVMRILDRSKTAVTLSSLGFKDADLDRIKNILTAPYGIILICGPTGSGKSTTLYAMLSEMDRESKNVVSIEDPVEYEIDGVAQSQVHPEIGYTFASGLRSILRQDPDIVMVGEIRDKETAQLAIQAALTGHLVFSTIHTNTAAGAIPRLIDMGVDPFLIAPTLVAAISQRLVRKICDGGGESQPLSESVKRMIEEEFKTLPEAHRSQIPTMEKIYRAVATPDCPSGMRGRVGAFEILEVDDDIEKVILTNPIEEKIFEAARAKGMLTVKEDAIIKALAGVIPFEEVGTLGGELLLEEASTEEVSSTAPEIQP